MRCQSISAMRSAFATASGPEMSAKPVARQPSLYTTVTLRLSLGGNPRAPATRTRSAPASVTSSMRKSVATSGVR
jgi:hypothetical protein